MKLDITLLDNAVGRLREGLLRYEQDKTDAQIRDGLIQRFEFTYEACHKLLKRYLEASSPTPEIYDQMPFSDMIRSANEQGLLFGDWSRWRTYRTLRGKTSHTYNESLAMEVVAGIPEFLKEAEYLRTRLKLADV